MDNADRIAFESRPLRYRRELTPNTRRGKNIASDVRLLTLLVIFI